MALVDLATCLLKDLSKRLLTDCSNKCPNESNKEIIEDFRLTESLLSQFFMIRSCVEEEAEEPDYSKIELALNNLIEKYQCLGCQSYTGGSISPDGPEPEDCDIVFEGDCNNLNIVPGANVVSIAYDIDTSGTYTGIPCPLAANGNIGNQVGNLVGVKYLCISENPSEEPEECNMIRIDSNTLVYVYYDGTSLGTVQVQTAYTAIMDWLNSQPGFTPITSTPSYSTTGTSPNTINPGENVFHTIIPGERWLDWGIQPITGEFHNDNVDETLYPGCAFIAQGDEVNGEDRIHCNSYVTAVANWSYDTANMNQFYDSVTGTFLGDDIGDYIAMGFPIPGPCTGLPCVDTLPCFIPKATGQNVWMGPPPAAPTVNNVLVIIFADESDCAYHGRAPSVTNYAQTFSDPKISSGTCTCNEVSLGFTTTVNAPTGIFKKDYDTYVSEYNTRQATPGAGTYKTFIYPSCPSNGPSTTNPPFPLHVAASIDSGDDTITPDGLFNVANVPTSSMYRSGGGGCGGNSSNVPAGAPAGGMILQRDGVNVNPYHSQNYGGLDQYGWGYNSEMLPFNNAIFEADLEVFLSDGTLVCGGLDCLLLKIREADNPTIPVVGEIVQVNGTPYTTDAQGEITVTAVSPGITTIGYANSECYTFPTLGDCTQYSIIAYKDTETYDTCVSFSDVQCGCGPEGGLTPDIVINVGATVPLSSGGLIGTITNETTGVVTNIVGSMISGPVDGDYIVTVPFENTPNDDIPDGRYTILLYGIGSSYTEYKECRIILCESSTIVQGLFKKFVSSKECCPCEKPFEDFVEAYSLFRALKVVGANDCEYETFIDENITKLQILLATAGAGNCKDC